MIYACNVIQKKRGQHSTSTNDEIYYVIYTRLLNPIDFELVDVCTFFISLLSYRLSLNGKERARVSEKDTRRERRKGSMTPIVSIDIGQVGNKNDSGTLHIHIHIHHMCVFNFTHVVYACVHMYVYCSVRLSSILSLLFILLLYSAQHIFDILVFICRNLK